MSESVPRYWRENKYREQLVGTKCEKCGKITFPPRMVCPNCRSRNLTEIALPRRGELISFSIVRKPPEEFKDHLPYAIGIIRLENGVNVIAQLTDVDLEEIKTGMKVEGVLRKYREEKEEGLILYGIKFRPILK